MIASVRPVPVTAPILILNYRVNRKLSVAPQFLLQFCTETNQFVAFLHVVKLIRKQADRDKEAYNTNK